MRPHGHMVQREESSLERVIVQYNTILLMALAAIMACWSHQQCLNISTLLTTDSDPLS